MYDIVTEIMTKAQKGNVAVFKIDGKVKIIPTKQAKRFDAMLTDYGRYLVGVYNNRVTSAYLKEDLA